jgi:hypothetical protein
MTVIIESAALYLIAVSIWLVLYLAESNGWWVIAFTVSNSSWPAFHWSYVWAGMSGSLCQRNSPYRNTNSHLTQYHCHRP